MADLPSRHPPPHRPHRQPATSSPPLQVLKWAPPHRHDPQHYAPQIKRSLQRAKIHIAEMAHLNQVQQMQRDASNQLGFLPTQSLRDYITAGHCGLLELDGGWAGYILFRPHLTWQPTLTSIIQLYVRPQFRRLTCASTMIRK